MPLSGWPASCLLPAHPTGVFPIRILCSVRYVCGVLPSVTPRLGFRLVRCRRRPQNLPHPSLAC